MRGLNVMVLDTETCPYNIGGGVSGGNALTYHIGYRILSPRSGKVFFETSHLISEIFLDEPERMASAYYAKKIPQYWEDAKVGLCDSQSFFAVMNEIKRLCAKFNVVAIIAHNANFDVKALARTAGYLMGEWIDNALPDNVEIWDSMKMAKPLYHNRRYIKFCNENQFLTARGQVRRTAEVTYRYIINDITFVEAHTALEDARIESVIVQRVFKTFKEEDRVTYRL